MAVAVDVTSASDIRVGVTMDGIGDFPPARMIVGSGVSRVHQVFTLLDRVCTFVLVDAGDTLGVGARVGVVWEGDVLKAGGGLVLQQPRHDVLVLALAEAVHSHGKGGRGSP